jgi:hypothetical protein
MKKIVSTPSFLKQCAIISSPRNVAIVISAFAQPPGLASKLYCRVVPRRITARDNPNH